MQATKEKRSGETAVTKPYVDAIERYSATILIGLTLTVSGCSPGAKNNERVPYTLETWRGTNTQSLITELAFRSTTKSHLAGFRISDASLIKINEDIEAARNCFAEALKSRRLTIPQQEEIVRRYTDIECKIREVHLDHLRSLGVGPDYQIPEEKEFQMSIGDAALFHFLADDCRYQEGRAKELEQTLRAAGYEGMVVEVKMLPIFNIKLPSDPK